MKDSVKKYGLLSSVIVIGMICGCGSPVSAKEEIFPLISEEELQKSEIKGDAGENEDDIVTYDVSTPLDIEAACSRMEITRLAIRYHHSIPFQDGERYLAAEYPVVKDGVDIRQFPEDAEVGMDSFGYVLWLYRNVFGVTPDGLFSPEDLLKQSAVPSSELQVGDIGIAADNKGKAHYGVCIGFYDDLAVFSHCSSIPAERYPGGTTRYSFLSSQTDRFFDGMAPENFTEFYRLSVDWRDE